MDQKLQRLDEEHNTLKQELSQLGTRRNGKLAIRIRPSAPSVIHASRVCAHISATVHGDEFQARETFQRPVEYEVVNRDRSIERIADGIVEIIPREPLSLGESVWM